MKVILLKDIKGVGKRFDEKEVSDGYGRNFLLPQNLAVLADKAGESKVLQLKSQSESKREAEEKLIKEKEEKRQAKHQELEQFRAKQRGTELD